MQLGQLHDNAALQCHAREGNLLLLRAQSGWQVWKLDSEPK
jgi:hypothetical protein